MRNQKRTAALLLGALLLLSTGSIHRASPAAGQAQLSQKPKVIALTFDDGPAGKTTERLLNGLRERGANGTFFLVGTQLQGNEDLVRRMRAEGHQIGNHTWSHARLPDSDRAGVLKEIQRGQEALASILEEPEKTFWLRPPYGLLEGTEGLQTPIIRWSIDPRDWESRDREAVVEHVLRYARPGAIILLHDLYESSVDAALEIVDRMQQEGYQFVTVDELLRLYGVTPKEGIIYSSGNGANAEWE